LTPSLGFHSTRCIDRGLRATQDPFAAPFVSNRVEWFVVPNTFSPPFLPQRMATDSPFHPLTSPDTWTAALEASDDHPVVVFKHSSACPTSARAEREMSGLAEDLEYPVYRVVVQKHREVSDAIAQETGVRHETPQVLLLADRSVVFDTSHHRVKADRVRDELSALA